MDDGEQTRKFCGQVNYDLDAVFVEMMTNHCTDIGQDTSETYTFNTHYPMTLEKLYKSKDDRAYRAFPIIALFDN